MSTTRKYSTKLISRTRSITARYTSELSPIKWYLSRPVLSIAKPVKDPLFL